MQSGLVIVHGNYLEELRKLANRWITDHPLHPLENEVILVQSNGIAQWLKLALAQDKKEGGSGIAAAVDIQLPARFLWQIYRLVLGDEVVSKRSALDKEPLIWRLLRLLPSCLHQPTFNILNQFLAHDSKDQRKLFQLAERLADLFDQYQVYRADWLQDWLEGKNQLHSLQDKINPLPKEHAWQASLWRLLVNDLGDKAIQSSRASIHQQFLSYCHQADTPPPQLPKRISIFGISSMPAQMIEAITTLAKFCQVILYVHNPCRYHWLDIIEGKQLLRHHYKRQHRKENQLSLQDLHQYGHPLLAAWGKQGRDYINLLDSYDAAPPSNSNKLPTFNEGEIDLYTTPNTHSLLGQLQDDILELRSLPETRTQWAKAIDTEQDHSIQFHIAHSPQREVEILHDHLLEQFNTTTDLTARDIIIMVPDINKYAPFIQAVFGQLPKEDPRYIPFTLADRGKRGFTPLLIALEYLLQLPNSRFAVTDILNLLDIPAIRKRFNWQEQDLPLLHRWIHESGIRWGIDAEQRASLDLPEAIEQNSWLFGLRRMLLGYMMGSSDSSWNHIIPFDEIGGNEAILIGSLSNFLAILDEMRQRLSEQYTPLAWAMLLKQLLDSLFSPTNETEETLLNQLAIELDHWVTLCEEAQLSSPLPLTIVKEAWLSGLDSEHSTQNFISGGVSFCTLMPMRAIPFQIICILGMNDGDYPRASPHTDFDLMAKDYRPGDRSRREDDRYLLLEALLSARKQLYISWIGRSVRDNTPRPPSVLIGQLRDHLSSGWKTTQGKDILECLTKVHPLQPFNPRYYNGLDAAWFSYAHEWLTIHQPFFLEKSYEHLTAFQENATLTLDQLGYFLKRPVRYFFNQRLKLSFHKSQVLTEDNEPFELTSLEQYQLRDKLLEHGFATQSSQPIQTILTEFINKQQQSGLLPFAGFGEKLGNLLINQVTPLLEYHQQLLKDYHLLKEPKPITIQNEAKSITLQDWLNGLYQHKQGQLLYCSHYAGNLLQGKHYRWASLIKPWIIHLAANSCNLAITTVLLGLDSQFTLPSIAVEKARIFLENILSAWQRGMQIPLPVEITTAFSWLSSEKNIEMAKNTYEGNDFIHGECQKHLELIRQFPCFDLLNRNHQFEQWVEILYQPLYEADWQMAAY